MTDQNLETTIGTIMEVLYSEHLSKENQPQLESPSEIYVTRVKIEQSPTQLMYTQLFGMFGQDAVGRKIMLIESYDQPEQGLRRYTQKIFIDGKLEVDKVVVKRF